MSNSRSTASGPKSLYFKSQGEDNRREERRPKDRELENHTPCLVTPEGVGGHGQTTARKLSTVENSSNVKTHNVFCLSFNYLFQ